MKRLYVKVLFYISGTVGNFGGWLNKLAIKISNYSEDKSGKWFYTNAYVLGSESEISDAIRNGSDFPVKQVALVADGGDYYLVYDYTIHKVIQVNKTRIYNTKWEAQDAISGFVKTRNEAVIHIDEATESGTARPTVEVLPNNKTKKGNGKCNIKHGKKQIKNHHKKGNGDFKKNPQPKKKVIKKVGK